MIDRREQYNCSFFELFSQAVNEVLQGLEKNVIIVPLIKTRRSKKWQKFQATIIPNRKWIIIPTRKTLIVLLIRLRRTTVPIS